MDLDFPIEPFNTLVKNGTAGVKIQKAMEDTKPEAAYFSERDGRRGGILIAEVSEPSQIPSFAEPRFLSVNARVQFRVAMTPEDLGRAGLEEIGKRYAS